MTAILQLPAWLGAILAMLLAIAASAIPFVVLRRLLSEELPTRTRDVAETVAVRIGTIHGLILALVFAEAQSTHTNLQQEVSKELTTIEHIALELNQWDGPEKDALRGQLAAYVTAALQNEWQASASLRGSREARRAYTTLDHAILNLKAETPQQQSLRTRMIMNMDTLQDHRKARLSLAHRGLPSLFWWMALTGFAIIVGFFLVFPANLVHIAILSVYGAYTGLALYFILALSHPYAGPAAIDTVPYEMVLEDELGAPRVTSSQ
ncbi:DUF4239 domain-containing protein [Microvirga sp. VF16]|uniref:bestrophin-like domain n=1 Tax=Microvirga sp. VF16 TaxID=2807101 RepID=UPI00193E0EC2|nr:DUF4239 domain-containing protein [Microvirga sp. VF16]QRM27787.1 DUF4239 domain-containing protein [Microvirga sp. VF16]